MSEGERTVGGFISLIHNWSRTEPFWLERQLRDEGFRVESYAPHAFRFRWRGRPRALISHVDTMLLGWQAARRAASEDGCVVATGDYMAGIFSSLTPPPFGHHRPPVLCVNMILYDKPGTRTRLRKFLHRLAISHSTVRFTVSTAEQCDHYARLLGANRERFVALTDCWAPVHRGFLRHNVEDDGGYVFVGGEAARDWKTALSVAECLGEIPFVFVARRRRWHDMPLPPNIDLIFDLPLPEFMETMAGARVVLLPLIEDSPTAGLLVLTHAGLMGRFVLVTRTPFTEQYFPPECQDLLVPVSDSGALVERITRWWSNHDDRTAAATRLRAYILERHSPEAYAERIAGEVGRMLAEDASPSKRP